MEEFTKNIIAVVGSIPKGKVASYGQVAALCGNPRAARQVARILHSQSRAQKLPWHRVVNKQLGISLPGERGKLQRRLLEAEKIEFNGDRILKNYLWQS